MIMDSNVWLTEPTKTTDFKVACVWVVAAFLISDGNATAPPPSFCAIYLCDVNVLEAF